MDCPEPAAVCGVCSLNNPGTALCGVSVMMEKNVRHPHPKIARAPYSNTEKQPDDWVSGNDPMTGAQASYLKTLSEECDESQSFQADLTKAEASKRIDALKAKRSSVRQR